MAGRIPQDFLDQLLARVDIVEVVDSRVMLRKSGREFAACCPFHNEKTPSFYVSPTKQFYHCFGCGVHGNAIDFLMAYEHLAFPEAVEELARLVGLEIPREAHPAQERPDDDLLAWVDAADRWFQRQLRAHPERQRAIDYLRGRGLSGEIAKAYGIGFAPPGRDALSTALRARGAALRALIAAGLVADREGGEPIDRFRDRIMFPIRDRRGRTIAFGGRILGDGQPKYLNSPESPVFHKGQELYGLYEARTSLRSIPRLLVVEGYMDVIMLAQHGVRYAVATLGTSTTSEHTERLFRITREVIFCFDGDRAGREAAWRALENVLPHLREGRQVGFLFLPEGEDPDSLVRREGREAFERRLGEAAPLGDYLVAHLEAQVDNLDSVDGHARLLELAKPLLERMPDTPLREMLVQRIGAGSLVHRFTRLQQTAPGGGTPAGRVDHRRTPVRHAIALLLSHPELATQVDVPPGLEHAPLPGIKLLTELLEMLRGNPHLPLGVLLERYDRGTTERHVLERLLAWQPEVAPEHFDFLGEFRDTLALLLSRQSGPKPLIDKLARGEPLSDEEKDALRRGGRPAE
ncbi:DNA primase [Plasticicumulans lactativorans]|uniref:DNA primase n=1 Tax=Plasticicumulans lactativorans TaxID=1133106 RepID=A0A4R2L4L5_9GAMM|nr:DNA primase [Plasticicumulans lactativorans]TCO82221.1 DNA primase [Plasticicumulans lactativorans]